MALRECACTHACSMSVKPCSCIAAAGLGSADCSHRLTAHTPWCCSGDGRSWVVVGLLAARRAQEMRCCLLVNATAHPMANRHPVANQHVRAHTLTGQVGPVIVMQVVVVVAAAAAAAAAVGVAEGVMVVVKTVAVAAVSMTTAMRTMIMNAPSSTGSTINVKSSSFSSSPGSASAALPPAVQFRSSVQP